MRASVINGEKSAAAVEDGDAITFDIEGRGLARGQVFGLRDFDKLCHNVFLIWRRRLACWRDARALFYIKPSCSLAASVIMPWFHCGSQTSSTLASSTGSRERSLFCTSCVRTGPMPQPGAVNVIFTSTR